MFVQLINIVHKELKLRFHAHEELLILQQVNQSVKHVLQVHDVPVIQILQLLVQQDMNVHKEPDMKQNGHANQDIIL